MLAFATTVIFCLTCDDLSESDKAVIGPLDSAPASRSKLLSNPRVQNWLQLSDDQRAECALLKRAIAAEGNKASKPPNAAIDEGVFRLIANDCDVQVDEILQRAQAKRLGQLQLQAFGVWAPFRLSCIVAYLEITDAQKAAAENLAVAQPRELSELIKFDKKTLVVERPDLSALKKLSERHRQERTAILSAAQRDRLVDLLGDPIDPAIWVEPARTATPFPVAKPGLRAAIGNYTQPFRMLFSDSFLDLLEVRPRQREKLEELVAKERRTMRERALAFDPAAVASPQHSKRLRERRAEDIRRLWKELDAILDANQVTRMRQVWLQLRGCDELFSQSETAALLKVTDEQNRLLDKYYKDRPKNIVVGNPADTRARMPEILTPEQKRKFAEVQGEAISAALLGNLRSAQYGGATDEFEIPTVGIGATNAKEQ